MSKIYFASPLFTEAERSYNEILVEKIKAEIIRTGNGMQTKMYVPQENMEINDKGEHVEPIEIFNADASRLLESDVLVAVLDGQVIDPGVALEIGMAVSAGIPTFALCSDIRTSGYDNKDKVASMEAPGNTPFFYYTQMVVGAVESMGVICSSSDELVSKLAEEINLLNKEGNPVG